MSLAGTQDLSSGQYPSQLTIHCQQAFYHINGTTVDESGWRRGIVGGAEWLVLRGLKPHGPQELKAHSSRVDDLSDWECPHEPGSQLGRCCVDSQFF